MRLSRIVAGLAVTAALAGLSLVGQVAEPSGIKLVAAADAFLESLTPEQKTKATFAFDDKERTNWWFVPRQDAQKKSIRKGVPLEQMTAAQKKAAMSLLKAGTSASGYAKALKIMSLEGILRAQEGQGAMVRNPEWYFFTIFGQPSKSGKWGWRVEGHHLALNYTMEGSKVVSATPAVFCANPATIKSGPEAGVRILPETEDHAWALFKALDSEQREVALQKQDFDEIEQAKTAPNVGDPKGVAGAKMTPAQKSLLVKLLETYATRLPEDVAASEMAKVRQAGIDKVHFAYTGGTEPGQPHTYRVQGPTFVIEFLNKQPDSAKNVANHIHSAWRNMQGDFGIKRTTVQ